MKEHPILFSSPMIRALLGGSKTQTRRICKNNVYSNGFHFDGHDLLCHNDYLPPSAMLMDVRCGKDGYTTSNLEGWEAECPYGQPRDRLWVRETWMPDAPQDGTWADVEFYGCKGAPLSHIPERYRKPEHCLHRATWSGGELIGWKPSIHMPRWASRIALEVTGVRVERLRDISEADAIAEGIEGCDVVVNGRSQGMTWRDYGSKCDDPFEWFSSPIRSYQTLWEQINGAGSWDVNPWVWVVEFKRVEQLQRAA